MSTTTILVLVIGVGILVAAGLWLAIDMRKHRSNNPLTAEPVAAVLGVLIPLLTTVQGLFVANSPENRYLAIGIAGLAFLASRLVRSKVTPATYVAPAVAVEPVVVPPQIPPVTVSSTPNEVIYGSRTSNPVGVAFVSPAATTADAEPIDAAPVVPVAPPVAPIDPPAPTEAGIGVTPPAINVTTTEGPQA